MTERETYRENIYMETNEDLEGDDEEIKLAPYTVGAAGRSFKNYLKTILMPDLLERLVVVEREKHARIERRKSDTANLEQLVKVLVENADSTGDDSKLIKFLKTANNAEGLQDGLLPDDIMVFVKDEKVDRELLFNYIRRLKADNEVRASPLHDMRKDIQKRLLRYMEPELNAITENLTAGDPTPTPKEKLE